MSDLQPSPDFSAIPQLQLDIAHDCTVGELLIFMETYNASIINFQANGPAGGNPLITFLFKDFIDRQMFYAAYRAGLANPVSVIYVPHSQKDQPE